MGGDVPPVDAGRARHPAGPVCSSVSGRAVLTKATILSRRWAAWSTSSRTPWVNDRPPVSRASASTSSVTSGCGTSGQQPVDQRRPGRPGRRSGRPGSPTARGWRRRCGRTGTVGPRPRRVRRCARPAGTSRSGSAGAARPAGRGTEAHSCRTANWTTSSAGGLILPAEQPAARCPSRRRRASVFSDRVRRSDDLAVSSRSDDAVQIAAQGGRAPHRQRLGHVQQVSSVDIERLAAGDVLHHQRSSSARNRSTVRFCRAWSCQRLTDDLAGQLDRDPAEVAAQLGDDLRPLRVQLGPAGRGDPLGLGVRLARACRRGWPGPAPGRPRGSWRPPRGHRPAAGCTDPAPPWPRSAPPRPWRCRPRWPWSARRRPSRTCGQTNLPSTTSSTAKAMAAMRTSPQGRPMGLVEPSSAAAVSSCPECNRNAS